MSMVSRHAHFFVLKVLIHLVDCRESIIFVVGKQFDAGVDSKWQFGYDFLKWC